jgi:hypothetical protein
VAGIRDDPSLDLRDGLLRLLGDARSIQPVMVLIDVHGDYKHPYSKDQEKQRLPVRQARDTLFLKLEDHPQQDQDCPADPIVGAPVVVLGGRSDQAWIGVRILIVHFVSP